MREERWSRGLAVMFTVAPLAYVGALMMGAGLLGARLLLFYVLGCAAVGLAVGRFLGRVPAVLQMVLCAALAAGFAWVLPAVYELAWLRYVVLALGVLFTLIVEYQTLHAGESSTSQPLLLPVATLLAACVLLWMYLRISGLPPAQPWGVLAAIGSAWIVVAVALLNRSSLRRAAWAHSQREVPAVTRRTGIIGTVAFLALCFVLSLVGAIGRALSVAADAIWRALVAAYLWLISHMLTKTETPDGGGNGQMQLPQGPEKAQPEWMHILLVVFGVLLALGGIALVLYLLYKNVPKAFQAIRDRLRKLYGGWADEEDPYHDKNESLLSLREAIAQVGARWERFARRFRPRPKLSDFDTDAERARFLFRELLHRLRQRSQEPPPGATAREILRSQRPADGMDALDRSYAAARYAEEQPDPRDVREAAQAMDVK